MYLGWVKNEGYLWSTVSPSRLRSVTLKPAAFEDAHFPPVASEANGWRSLNTNLAHKFENFLKTNQELNFLLENNSIHKFSIDNRKKLNYGPC